MGFDANGVNFILDATKNGVVLKDCALLGRQEMHLTIPNLKSALKKYKISYSKNELEEIMFNNGENGFSETFLKKCGATSVTSFDNSSFEGATVVHDMNTKISEDHYNKYDCVIDGGTLEHIFNVPVALLNCMNMVKRGGYFLSLAPCNNFMGHGFYQFSPELFYSIFCEKNGFIVERMFILESIPNAQWYEVANPFNIGCRVELVNSKVTYLYVQARRIDDIYLADIKPQQSDYVAKWASIDIEKKPALSHKTNEASFRVFKGHLKYRLNKLLHSGFSLSPFNKPYFKKHV